MTADQTDFLHLRTAAWGIRLEEEAITRLARFFELLAAWNRHLRLVGERDLDLIVRKHGLDSLAPARYLPPSGLTVDIGSGGGFPGIVLGCVRPDIELVLLDSRRRPVSFLREVVRNVPLPKATAVQVRAESAAHDASLASRARVVIGRGLRVDIFLRLARPLLGPEGIAITMQTPRAGTVAAGAARRSGMRLTDLFDYQLAPGEARRLLVFEAAADAHADTVS